MINYCTSKCPNHLHAACVLVAVSGRSIQDDLITFHCGCVWTRKDLVIELSKRHEAHLRTRIVECTPDGDWCDVPIIHQESPK